MQIPIVSIVTVSFNSFKTISLTIDSVLNQTYHNIEYIVIDSGSTDGTVDLIKSYGGRIDRFISEPDKGIYDAINKGIRLSTGEIIGILNSDDFFYDNNIIQKVVDAFSEKQVDAVYGDLLFVDRIVTTKVTRKYSS
ncbi:MAG: glycosyltransferase, partial [Bacteroidetes bacterium]